jgi:hypothetical protein
MPDSKRPDGQRSSVDASPIRERSSEHLAICDDDRCPWKHRGVTALGTSMMANAHAEARRHAVSVYRDGRKVTVAR